MIGLEIAPDLSILGMKVGDLATWAGAIATSGALWVAIVGLNTERKRRVALEETAAEQLKRQQADRVFAWYGGFTQGFRGTSGFDALIVRNDSNLPVYDAVVSLVFAQGAGPKTGEELAEMGPDLRDLLRKETFVIPPGIWQVRITASWRGMSARAGAEVAFRDTRGNYWARRSNGTLDELPAGPFEHLRVPIPLDDYQLERID